MTNSVFPRYGRVAIVDDKYDEVRLIQNLLAESGVPYIFYDYEYMHEMDIEKVDGIRLLFLDIRLESGNDGTNIMNIKTVLASTIERIIPPKNGPYIIILWTNEYALKDEITEYLDAYLDEEETTKPVFIGAIDKKDFLGKTTDDLKSIIEDYCKTQSMVAFLSRIEENTMQIPQNVMKLIVYEVITDLNNDMLRNLFLKMASIEIIADGARGATKNVLSLFSELIRDRYMEIVAKDDLIDELSKYWDYDFKRDKDLKQIRDKINMSQDSVINTVLNVNTYSGREENIPGKVFRHTEQTLDISIDDLYASSFKNEPVIDNVPIELVPVEVDITPSCDYANGKAHMLRTIYGYACYFGKMSDGSNRWKELKYSQKISNFASFDYIYVTPTFMIDGRLCVLALNTKLMDLKRRDYSEKLEYLFRLNNEITNEIRKKSGEVISRLGINKI